MSCQLIHAAFDPDRPLGPARSLRAALCDERHQQVVIDDPFIELHTGPGRGYPVFYIAERGEQIQLLKEKTDWYKVQVPRGKEGWVYRDQLKTTLNLDGEPFDVPGVDFADYAKRRWESGIMYGSFGGADGISAYGSFNLTQNLAAELWLTQVLGPYPTPRSRAWTSCTSCSPNGA